MHEKYLKAYALLMKLWEETVPGAVALRTRSAFDALLPSETIENVKRTCISLATEKIIKKVNDWRGSYMRGTGLWIIFMNCLSKSLISPLFLPEIFSKTIRSDAERLAKTNFSESEHQTTFSINLSSHHPSQFFNALHEIQHNASLHPHKISKESLLHFLDIAYDILSKQTFTTNLCRTCGLALLCLIQTLIVMKPALIDDDVLDTSNKIWKMETMFPLITKQETPTDESLNENQLELLSVTKKRTSRSIFANLISPRFILQLDESPTIDTSLKCLLNWLKSLVDSQLVTIVVLSDMFVSLFQYEWSKENLEKIRYLSKSLSEYKSGSSCLVDDDDRDEKSNLFLDLVADLAINLEI